MAAMTQGKFGHGFDVFFGDGGSPPPGRMGAGAAQPDEVGAQAIDTGGEAALGDLRQGLVIQLNAVKPRPRLGATLAQGGLMLGPLGAERSRVGVEIQAPTDDLPALGGQGLPTQRHVEAEAVEQLRT